MYEEKPKHNLQNEVVPIGQGPNVGCLKSMAFNAMVYITKPTTKEGVCACLCLCQRKTIDHSPSFDG